MDMTDEEVREAEEKSSSAWNRARSKFLRQCSVGYGEQATEIIAEICNAHKWCRAVNREMVKRGLTK